jgi:thiamine-phosphate pyrophosphorylase
LGAVAPRLYLVTDRRATRGRDLVAVVTECVGAGVPAVQVREKDLPRPELVRLSRRLAEVARGAGAQLFVNGDVEVACEAGADGVHRPHALVILPEDAQGLRLAGSTHSLIEARQAEDDGLDFIVFGPIYETPSKRAFGPPQGVDALRKVCASVQIPVLAIGGITPERVRDVRDAGAVGVAVISAILSAESPPLATHRFLEALAGC